MEDATNLSITGYSKVEFNGNTATRDGGEINVFDHSITVIKDYSKVTFQNNKVQQNGGAIHGDFNSDIHLEGNI